MIKTVLIGLTYDTEKVEFEGFMDDEIESFFEGLSLTGLLYNCNIKDHRTATEDESIQFKSYLKEIDCEG